jgi:hypothetical protein
MKYISSIFIAACCSVILLSSCGGTSQSFNRKAAYMNNEQVHLPNEKITDITIFDVSFKSDKSMYETISQQLQAAFNKQGISSDMRFYDASETPAFIADKLKELTKPYYIIIDKVISGTQKDEMNNDMMTNQINCMLIKNGSGHVADFTISIDNQIQASKLGKQIAGVIVNYLAQKKFI